MKCGIAIFFLALGLSSSPSFGQTSCLPPFTSAQVVHWISKKSPQSSLHPLWTWAHGDLVETKVRLQIEPTPLGHRARVFFDPGFQGVSLPYNLYAVLVIIDGKPIYFHDYTYGCQGAGLSFYPGRQVELPLIKTVGDSNQKLQIMVWGKI